MTSGGGREFHCVKCGAYSQSSHEPLCLACWFEDVRDKKANLSGPPAPRYDDVYFPGVEELDKM
jgi:hypothetical protein